MGLHGPAQGDFMTTNPTGADIGGVIAELRELLDNATPGPFGFQSYGRRERLVTMAVGEGCGESFAIFNRAEDARAFAAAVRALPSLLSHIAGLEEHLRKVLDSTAITAAYGEKMMEDCVCIVCSARSALSYEKTRIEE